MHLWRDADEIYCWECGAVEPQDCQCEGAETDDEHSGHDVWPLISQSGITWCRTCRVHFE